MKINKGFSFKGRRSIFIINLKTAGNITTHLNVLLDLPSTMFFKVMKTW